MDETGVILKRLVHERGSTHLDQLVDNDERMSKLFAESYSPTFFARLKEHGIVPSNRQPDEKTLALMRELATADMTDAVLAYERSRPVKMERKPKRKR